MASPNRVREMLEDGGTVIGARAKTHAPPLIEVYGQLGFDFVWLDFEHGGATPHDTTHLADLARACEVGGIEPLVRLPDSDPVLVRKALDAGLSTLLIPRIETAEEVKQVVAASRYLYDGRPGDRGHAGSRETGYGAHLDTYRAGGDRTAFVGVMIERKRAFENLDEILEVPDLGFAFVGPGDLAVSLRHPMEPDHPEVREVIGEIRRRCSEAGVPVGRPVDETGAAQEAIDAGYRVVRAGDELSAVRSTLAPRLEALRGE